jgi:WD40 repeat protein/serine/threonine protein kinase
MHDGLEATLRHPATVISTDQVTRSESNDPRAATDEWEIKDLPVRKPGDEILGLYRIERVSSGGMGRVYIAEHLKWKVKMAIKAPNRMMLSDEYLFRRILKEAESWTELGLHPHIAYCYYVRKIEEVPHIFIEYLDGGNLRDWIADMRCYDLRVALDLAIQFCHGMEYAHGKGMIHRDIKPENILLTTDGVPKITDFGLVRTGAADSAGGGSGGAGEGGNTGNLTTYGIKMGSYDYMPPEQWENPGDVDERADVFSFGACLYEMILGRLPYDPASEIAASYVALKKGITAQDPITLRQDIPTELSNLLKRSVALRREDRPASFSELRKLLTEIYGLLFHERPPHTEIEGVEARADSLNNRAVSFLDLAREGDALKSWEEALEMDPHHLEATFNSGYLRWSKGMIPLDLFLGRMRGLESVHFGNPAYWHCLAYIYFEIGDLQAVEELQCSEHRVDDEEFNRALQDNDKPVGRLLCYFEGHTESVKSVCFSPDGRFALSGSNDKTLRLWDIEDRWEVLCLEGHEDIVTSACFSPDGRFALSGSWDNTVRLWDIESGAEVRRFEGHYLVNSACFSPDGRLVLSGGEDKVATLWEVESGRELRRIIGHTDEISSVRFSPDGRFALSGSWDNTVRLWDIESGAEVRRFEGHYLVNSACFSPDGQLVLSGGEDKVAILWEVESGGEVRRFEGHPGPVNMVGFSPDGRFAYSASDNSCTVRVWEVVSGKEIRQLEGHTGWPVMSACFSPDCRFVLSGSKDENIGLWEFHHPKQDWSWMSPYPLPSRPEAVARLTLHRREINELLEAGRACLERGLASESYRLLRQAGATTGYARDREVLDRVNDCAMKGHARRTGLKDTWQVRCFEGNSDSITSVCISPDARFALTGSEDKTIRFWDMQNGREVRRFEETKPISYICFSPDGRLALSGSPNHMLRLWEIESGREIHRFEGHTGPVNSVCFSPNGRFVLSGSSDKTVRLWEAESGKEVRCLRGHTYSVYSVCFSPDGRLALSGSWDNTLRLWEIESGKEIHRFEGHTEWVNSVCFSPNGRFALSGSSDEIRIWDIGSGREVHCLVGHEHIVTSVCFSPDGQFVLSGSHDKTVRLWEAESGKEVRCLEGHTGPVISVCFSPNGRFALSGGGDNRVVLWQFDWEWEFDENLAQGT